MTSQWVPTCTRYGWMERAENVMIFPPKYTESTAEIIRGPQWGHINLKHRLSFFQFLVGLVYGTSAFLLWSFFWSQSPVGLLPRKPILPLRGWGGSTSYILPLLGCPVRAPVHEPCTATWLTSFFINPYLIFILLVHTRFLIRVSRSRAGTREGTFSESR